MKNIHKKIIEAVKSGYTFEKASLLEGASVRDSLRELEIGLLESRRVVSGSKPRKAFLGAYEFYTGYVEAKAFASFANDQDLS